MKNLQNPGIVGGGLVLVVLAILYLFPLKFTWQQGRTVTVTGTAKTQKTNEVAQFTAGVNTVGDDKQEAVQEANTKVAELIKAVKKFGIDPKDIKTQNLNIYQNQEQVYEDGRQKQKLGQWSVSNTVEISLRDVKRANELADLLSQSGANNIYGPNFSLENDTAADTDLTKQAVADAHKKAEAMAKASGSKLGKVLVVHEGNVDNSAIYYDKGMGGGGANVETEVGSTTVSKSVTVTFELR